MLNHFIKKIVFKNNISIFIFSVLFDLIGLASFTVPVLGEFSDVIWAPIASYIMLKMYPSRTGKLASI